MNTEHELQQIHSQLNLLNAEVMSLRAELLAWNNYVNTVAAIVERVRARVESPLPDVPQRGSSV